MTADRRNGLFFTVTGVALMSPDGLLVRLIDAGPWTLAAWRGVMMGTVMLLMLAAWYRGRLVGELRQQGWRGAVAAAGMATSNICFINALAGTGVADTLVIIAAAPLMAALLSRFGRGTPVSRRTWIATVAVVAGLATLLSGELGGRLGGDLWAFGSAAGSAVYLVASRSAAPVSTIPSIAIGDLLGGLAVIPFAPTLAVPSGDVGWLLLLGLLVLPVSFTLVTIGPRYLRAPEVGLLLLLESVLGPIWVWLALDEVPARATVLGGIVVLVTLAAYEFAGDGHAEAPRKQPARTPAT